MRMLSDQIAIQVKSLSKTFKLFDSEVSRLKSLFMPSVRRFLRLKQKQYFQPFTALDDVSFTLKKGSSLGVIGVNGSGKSTLLQLLCGTLSATEGEIKVNGKVAALLELGSGFNPEFTGRENIYLNASILGLTEQEISERFDKIVEFSGIGEFVEQPVKSYSSGMYVRLAFAIIAHVDADVLIIDEAFAVGDAIFIQKCMRYIRDFQRKGSLIFVSHDTASVQNLCDQCLWLNKGTVMGYGVAKDVTDAYLHYSLQAMYGDSVQMDSHNSKSPSTEAEPQVTYQVEGDVISQLEAATGWKTGGAEVLTVNLETTSGQKLTVYKGGEKVKISINARAHEPLENAILGFYLKDRLGQILMGENTLSITNKAPFAVEAGQTVCATFTFRLPMLPNGDFVLAASIADGTMHDNLQHHFLHDALLFHVNSSTVRWGLMGIPFERVTLDVNHD